MKLENSGSLIMVSALILFLAGCKPKSGFDQLVSQMDNAKAVHSNYVVHMKGQPDVAIDFLHSKPGRFIVTAEDFTIDSNEADGHFETIHSQKLYDSLPWDSEAYPGTGKLVPTFYVMGGPLCAKNPKGFAPEFKWVLKSNTGGQETYVKTVQTMTGPQEYTLVVNDKGQPVKFIAPGEIVYEMKTFEYLDEQPLEKFRIEPKDNYVSIRTQLDQFNLRTGQKFDWKSLQVASDVASFSLKGETLFAIVDPSEATSKNAANWIAKPSNNYKKVTITKGQATSGFFDPEGKEIAKMTSFTPGFVLVGEDGVIKGMWQGFDADGVKAFENDIQKAIDGD